MHDKLGYAEMDSTEEDSAEKDSELEDSAETWFQNTKHELFFKSFTLSKKSSHDISSDCKKRNFINIICKLSERVNLICMEVWYWGTKPFFVCVADHTQHTVRRVKYTLSRHCQIMTKDKKILLREITFPGQDKLICEKDKKME